MRAITAYAALLLCLSVAVPAQQKKPERPGDNDHLDVRVPEAIRGKLGPAAVWVDADKKSGEMGVLVYRSAAYGLVVAHNGAVPRVAGKIPQVACTFNPGQKSQRKIPANVVANEGLLILLKVEGRDLPAPIRCDDDLEWKSGQPLYAVFFDGPSSAKGFEGKVNFASIDAEGTPRIDRDSMAHNSSIQVKTNWRVSGYGGYAVDSKGTLVGIFNNGGGGNGSYVLAHPFAMARALNSGIRAATLTEAQKSAEAITLDVHASLGNWTNEITGVWLLTAPRGEAGAADGGGPPKPLPNATVQKLEVDERHAGGELTIQNETAAPSVTYQIQFKLARKSGKPEFTEPRDLTIAFQARDSATSDTAGAAHAKAPFEIDPGRLPEPRAEPLKLLAALVDARVGGAGRWIAIRMAGVPGLGILDLAAPDNLPLLRLPETEFAYAVGGDRLVVLLPNAKTFEVWDLEKRALVKRAACELDGLPFELAMGSASAAQFASFRPQTARDSGVLIDLFSTETLRPTTTPKPRTQSTSGGSMFGRGSLTIATNSGLSKIAYWWKSQRVVIPARWYQDGFVPSGSHSSGACFALAEDGAVYSDSGAVLDDADTELGQLVSVTPFPGVCSTLVLGVAGDGALKLFAPGRLTPVADVGRLDAWPPPQATPNRAVTPPILKRVIFAPHLKRLVYFPFENDRVCVQKIDVDEAIKSAANVIVVTSQPPAALPGMDWTYRVQTSAAGASLQYELQIAPDGMRVAADGTITWAVPDAPASASEKVILRIAGADGSEAFHSFVLRLWVPKNSAQAVGSVPPKRAPKVHEFKY